MHAFEKTIELNVRALEWLKYHYKRGAEIASACTGGFFLAATGLLDGKTATTHWGFVNPFRKLFPEVKLRPERLITDEGNLYCSGALYPGIDLSVYLVQKYCGHGVAVQCSKTLIHDMDRNSQMPYAVFEFQKKHKDEKIITVQRWIEEHFEEKVNFDEVAKESGMSRRTFERRFKSATGDTPLLYLQRTRVETARRLLERQFLTFDEICHRLGYENSNSFREVFRKHTGLLPTEYRRKFSIYPDPPKTLGA